MPKMMKKYEATINWNRQLNDRYFHLSLECPALASLLQPGQFVHLRCNEQYDPFLRRPFSVYRICAPEGHIELVILLKGQGTHLLSALKPGDTINLLGPLGNHYPLEFNDDGLLLLGRGVGMASMVSLAEASLRQGSPVQALISARSERDLIGKELLESLGAEVYSVWDDNRSSDMINVQEWLNDQIQQRPQALLVTCGSNRMGRMAAKVCRDHSVRGYISMEAHMACGIGVCYGCVCKTESGYQRVCKEGPVFPIGEVVFHDEL